MLFKIIVIDIKIIIVWKIIYLKFLNTIKNKLTCNILDRIFMMRLQIYQMVDIYVH